MYKSCGNWYSKKVSFLEFKFQIWREKITMENNIRTVLSLELWRLWSKWRSFTRYGWFWSTWHEITFLKHFYFWSNSKYWLRYGQFSVRELRDYDIYVTLAGLLLNNISIGKAMQNSNKQNSNKQTFTFNACCITTHLIVVTIYKGDFLNPPTNEPLNH